MLRNQGDGVKALYFFIQQIHLFAGKKLYLNLIAMGAIGLMASVATLLLVPLIALTGIVDFGLEENILFKIFGFISQLHPAIALPVVLLFYCIVIIIQNIISRQVQVENIRIQNGFLRHMRIETYNLLLYTNWNFFIKKRKSDLINMLTGEISKASFGAYSVSQFASSLIFTAVQIGLAFLLAPSITIFVLLCGFILIIINRKFLGRSLKLGNRNMELSMEYMAGITDQMNGIKDIKSNTLEESRMQWFRNTTKQIENEQVEYTRVKTTSQLYYKIASSVFIAIFIYFAIQLFTAQVAELMLIILIFGRLWPTVSGIQSTLERVATMLPSLKLVQDIQNECKQTLEFELEDGINITPIQVKNNIQFEHVYFRYNENHNNYALKDIHITIPANRMTAIVGHSGAGKSTLIDIIMGLNKPVEGQVLIDGMPLKGDKIYSLRKSISYVSQDPFLFNTSIRENLLLVRPDASEEEMEEALQFSSAAEFVYALPNGLDTVIGDRGVKLSGGERQRVVLARAILRNPSILVLDEATSALDTENEAKIQEAIDRLKGKMTIIVIAHRLSTIRNADQVIVLEKGEVIQQGGFKRLSKEKNSAFSTLLNKQLEGLI